MITEDYVSFEIAKLLKEKGFDAVKCQNSPHFAYNIDGQFSGPSWDTVYIAPTLQMAMKWLRKVHNLFIEIMVGYDDGKIWYDFDVINIGKKDIPIVPIDDIVELDSYEEACDAAIKYCLKNLI